jgi:hypothetical protein
MPKSFYELCVILETSDEEWMGNTSLNVGQLAILSDFGFKEFTVMKIVSFEEAAKGEGYELKDKNTVISHNPFGDMEYKRGQSVPCKTIKAFGDIGRRSETYHSGYHFVGAQNLYKTIDDLVKKQLGVVYPDLVIELYKSPNYQELVKQFPTLKSKQSVLDQIEYHPFEVHGYSVIVCPEKWAKKRAEEYKRSGYTHPIGIYYFTIPELKIRSTEATLFGKDKELLKTLKVPESGLFPNVKDALDAAERYISYLFYPS